MKIVFDYAKGRISHEEFEAELYLHPEIWLFLQSLVPTDISNSDCAFRSFFPNMKGLETNNYNLRAFLSTFGYNYNQIHSTICSLLKYYYPNLACKNPDENTFLEKCNLEYIGGKDADLVVHSILTKNQTASNKRKKELIEKAFNVTKGHYPHWVQEPEWPVHDGTPLRFIRQTNDGEVFYFDFEDISSGEKTTIEQIG